MCENAPVHHANHTDDLLRVDRGMYRRLAIDEVHEPVLSSVTASHGIAKVSPVSEPADPDWFWEGHVQSYVVSGLASSGWRIVSVANTQTRATGTDVVAEKDGRRLHVEVKGYPSSTYARGDRRGQPKPTHPATQARHWFAGALLKAAMLRGDHPSDGVAIGLPVFETYLSLVRRISSTLLVASIDLIWVDQSGDVRFERIAADR